MQHMQKSCVRAISKRAIFKYAMPKNYATKWTLFNQVTGKSEVKQKHETSKSLKLT
jgi:hypothetical protein